MTDKQIIIDEINKTIEQEMENLRNIAKQQIGKLEAKLKAKEQECEELKSDNLQEVGQLKFAIGTLTAENLHLKELLDMRIETLCDSCKAGSMLPIKCRIYEKALTEIKEIAERDKEFCIKCNGDKEIDCIDCIEGGRALLAKEILQKISECEVMDEL